MAPEPNKGADDVVVDPNKGSLLVLNQIHILVKKTTARNLYIFVECKSEFFSCTTETYNIGVKEYKTTVMKQLFIIPLRKRKEKHLPC